MLGNPLFTAYHTLPKQDRLAVHCPERSEWVRRWNGWQQQLTLALLAGAFLMGLEQEWGGISRW